MEAGLWTELSAYQHISEYLSVFFDIGAFWISGTSCGTVEEWLTLLPSKQVLVLNLWVSWDLSVWSLHFVCLHGWLPLKDMHIRLIDESGASSVESVRGQKKNKSSSPNDNIKLLLLPSNTTNTSHMSVSKTSVYKWQKTSQPYVTTWCINSR